MGRNKVAMEKHEILFKNDWVSLHKVVDVDNGVNGYVYSHETRCGGEIIGILPFRKVVLDKRRYYYEFLVRREVVPCWKMSDSSLCLITGGIEKKMSPEEVVVEEMKEESGFLVKKEEVINLGISRGTKSTDTIYHLYSVNLTDSEKGEAIGDGSYLESIGDCVWLQDLSIVDDPFVMMCYYRILKNRLLGNVCVYWEPMNIGVN